MLQGPGPAGGPPGDAALMGTCEVSLAPQPGSKYAAALRVPADGESVYLSNMTVAPPFRRRGAGAALLAALECLALQWLPLGARRAPRRPIARCLTQQERVVFRHHCTEARRPAQAAPFTCTSGSWTSRRSPSTPRTDTRRGYPPAFLFPATACLRPSPQPRHLIHTRGSAAGRGDGPLCRVPRGEEDEPHAEAAPAAGWGSAGCGSGGGGGRGGSGQQSLAVVASKEWCAVRRRWRRWRRRASSSFSRTVVSVAMFNRRPSCVPSSACNNNDGAFSWGCSSSLQPAPPPSSRTRRQRRWRPSRDTAASSGPRC